MNDRKTSHQLRVLLLFIFCSVLMGAYFFGGRELLDLSYLQSRLEELKETISLYPLQSGIIFFALYVLVTALSFPGAAVLTLLAGALFGLAWGTLIVSFASTIGSLMAFLLARFLFRDFLSSRFQRQFETINQNLKRDGALYLLTLRLVPLFPFFVINLVMGLTGLGTWTFTWVSQLGMLPGTFAYVYAGRKFSELSSLKGILSLDILMALTILGFLPYFGKALSRYIRNRKIYRRFQRPGHFDYNLAVVGAGAAGLVSAYIASQAKAKVALIERSKMGGDCLNTGCVPSKALLKTAKVVHLGRRARDFGLTSLQAEFDFAQVMERVQRVIKEVEPHDSVERYEGLGVDCIKAHAKLISPWELQVDGKRITARNIIIATGAGPLVPALDGIQQAKYVTSDTLWNLRELPRRLLVIGGGPVGCELAQAFARLGSKVYLIEGGPFLLNKEDPAVGQLLLETFREEGIDVYLNAKALGFTQREGEQVLLADQKGIQLALPHDLALIALGRKPHTQGLGLEELGIGLAKTGAIEVNERLQTSVPNIYACGDVAGRYQLTHMAAHEAWYSSVNSLLSPMISFKVDYRIDPRCTYTDPEIASVGETELSAKRKGLEYELTQFDLDDLDRAIADDEKKGFVRVLTKKGSDRILGATIAHSQASTMLLEFVSAMKYKKGLNSILGTIHAYPSMGEGNKYAAGAWKRTRLSPHLLRWAELFFEWKRN